MSDADNDWLGQESLARHLLKQRNALIAAGDELAEFSQHDEGICNILTGPDLVCTCGCQEARMAWQKAKES